MSPQSIVIRRVLVRDASRGRDRSPRDARGCSGRDVSRRASFPAARLVPVSPRGRTPSRKDGTGSASRASGSRRNGRRATAQSAPSSRNLRQQLCDHGYELNGLVRHADENVPASQLWLIQAEPFAQRAPHAVPIHSSRYDAAWNDQTQTRATQLVRPRPHRNACAARSFARREQRVDVLAAQSLFTGVALRAAQTTPRRARPFARRARITARPPRVRIRTRNPCVRLRRSTEG
jgi:hypothetical protein